MGIPAKAKQLLDFIGDIEAPKGYGTIFGNNQHRLKKPLTSMTVDEVIANQRNWTKRYESSAAGRYQFMRATLTEMKKKGLCDGSDLFDAALQDRLGYELLQRRGFSAFMAGRINRTEFGKRLAQEWASLPVLAPVQGGSRHVTRGQSYYAGDGLNKSLVKPERVEAVLASLLGSAPAPEPAQPHVPIPPPPDIERTDDAPAAPQGGRRGLWAAILAALGIGGGATLTQAETDALGAWLVLGGVGLVVALGVVIWWRTRR